MLENRKYFKSSTNVNTKINANKSENIIPFINYNIPAPTCCIDMLLAKYNKKSYNSEVRMVVPPVRKLPKLSCALADATILLITDGGIVPEGNPDKIPSSSSNIYGIYPIEKIFSDVPSNFEIVHQGYDNSYVLQDPNRLLPVDALDVLISQHKIGNYYNEFISTSGVMTSKEQCQILGHRIAKYVSKLPIQGVLITSACGTSTRCGSIIGLAIEEFDIPVVQVTNLNKIAEYSGMTRVLKGRNICYPFGNPSMNLSGEVQYRFQLTLRALSLLEESFEK